MLIRNDTIMFARRVNTCKVQEFPVLHDRRLKTLKKRDIVQNTIEKTAENLNFVVNSNFFRGSTEAAACGVPM